jgi:hypothetical protein
MNLQYSGLFFQVFSHAVFLSPFVLPYFFRFSVMQYFSHRLFWQNEKGSIVVGDLECNFTSEITVTETGSTVINSYLDTDVMMVVSL